MKDQLIEDGDVLITHTGAGMTWSPTGMTKATTLLAVALTFTRG